jgi:hypothetical protein
MPRWRCLHEGCPIKGKWQVNATKDENEAEAAGHEMDHQRAFAAARTADDAQNRAPSCKPRSRRT